MRHILFIASIMICTTAFAADTASEGPVTIGNLTVGEPLPTFMLPLHGTDDVFVASRDFVGEPRENAIKRPRKVLVISFFASWCGPCIKEIPALEKVSKEWGDGAATYLLNVGDKPAKVDKWLKKNPTQLPILTDRYKKTAVERYGVITYPTVLVVDTAGVIRYAHSGYRAGDEMAVDAAVRALLD